VLEKYFSRTINIDPKCRSVTSMPTTHLSESLKRIESVDALRGLAALLVVCNHVRSTYWIGITATYHRYGMRPDFSALIGYLSAPLGYGSLGVTLFFVLSGYCIHRRGAQRLAKDSRVAFDYKAFAIRRFWRIYPTYVAALLFTALVDWWILARTGVRDPGQDDSLFAFVTSLLTLQGYFAYYFGSNLVFWTLAMEVHLYLAYPILFLLSKKFGPGNTLLFTLAVGVAYLAANALFGIEDHLPYRFQKGPIFLPYWFTWALGFYIAEIEAGRAQDFGKNLWRALTIIGFTVGACLTWRGWHERAEMFWALFFGGLLYWSLGPQGRRFWGRGFGIGLAFVGVFSYSLYAIHVPLLEVFHVLIASSLTYKFSTIWPALGAAACSVIGAWLFFYLVEWWSIRKPRAAAVQIKQ